MEEKQDFLSKMSQKAQEAMGSETAQKAKEKAREMAESAAQKAQEVWSSEAAQKAKEKAREVAGAAAQKAQEALNSETAQKAKAAAGAAVQEAQQAVSEAVAETAEQAQRVYAAAQAGEGAAAIKKAKFSKKTLVAFGVVAVLIIVLLGIAGITSGGGNTEAKFISKAQKLLETDFEIVTDKEMGMKTQDGSTQYYIIHKPSFDKEDPWGCIVNLNAEKGKVVEASIIVGHNNPTGAAGIVAGSIAFIRTLDPSLSEDEARTMAAQGISGGGFNETVNGITYLIGDGGNGYIFSAAVQK